MVIRKKLYDLGIMEDEVMDKESQKKFDEDINYLSCIIPNDPYTMYKAYRIKVKYINESGKVYDMTLYDPKEMTEYNYNEIMKKIEKICKENE
jgi:hypothetical protein